MKTNPVIYKKLLAQAEEAKERGMSKMANAICNAIGSYPIEERESYSYNQLQEDLHQDMWKMASRLMYYYGVKSVDAGKLDQDLVSLAEYMLGDLERTLGVDEQAAGDSEPVVPGQK